MLSKIELTNFRNYSDKVIEFNDKNTIITGRNGIGKTNILEAIFTNLFTKSFRSSDKDLIKTKEDYFRIQTTINKTPIILHYTTNPKNKKTLKVNYGLSTLRKNIGQFPVILFEPNTIMLFSNNPSYRRKYLDILLYQLDSKYIENAIIYNKTLKQRNTWLRIKKQQGIKADPNEQIFIYNIQLATSGAYLTSRRQRFLKQIEPYIQKYYLDISKENKSISTSFIASNNSEQDLLEKIQTSWYQDISAGRTLVGSHREDFNFSFDNQPITDFASRGELRTVLLALKFSELELFRDISKNPPILLLDDVFSELDENRQKLLLNQDSEFQTIITSTHLPYNIKHNYQHIELV